MATLWGVDENTGGLFYQDGDSNRIYPTASEVFMIAFSQKSEAEKIALREINQALPNLTFKPSLAFPKIQISLNEGGEASLSVSLDNSKSVFHSLPTGDQVVADNTWYSVDTESFNEVRLKLESRNIQLGAALSPSNVAWLLWDSGLVVEMALDLEELRRQLLERNQTVFDSELLEANLFQYQRVGATFVESMLNHGRGVLLADEMGLGKTMQALYAIASNVKNNKRKNLVVVPSSNLANWVRELSRFAPSLNLEIHAGSSRAGSVNSLLLGDVMLTSYDIVLRDQAFLSEIPWDLIVLDEAQNIKNADSKRSHAVCSLLKSASLAITGTPIENSFSDVWAIFKFLDPKILGNKQNFLVRFPDTYSSGVELSKALAPFVVRRRVADVAKDLPNRSDFYVPIFLSPEMSSGYEEIRLDPALKLLPKMLALRQFCAVKHQHSASSNKTARLLELIEEAFSNGDKAIIFASFTEAIDLLVRSISSKFPTAFVATLDGRKSSNKRQEVIDQFGKASGAAVLIANPKAAGVGLNIQAANYVFHFNPEWNPATIAQASARSFRRGQKKNVFIYYLYYRGTVEEYVLKKLEEKTALQEAGTSEFSAEPSERQMLQALSISPSEVEGFRR
jgi:SNF2 family DNA or RNA helicase